MQVAGRGFSLSAVCRRDGPRRSLTTTALPYTDAASYGTPKNNLGHQRNRERGLLRPLFFWRASYSRLASIEITPLTTKKAGAARKPPRHAVSLESEIFGGHTPEGLTAAIL